MKMIDVSEFQGKIYWNKVKASGIEGVIIRAGYGKGNADGYFVRNITGAIKQKLHVGIYWFSYAYTKDMAQREARFCNDLIQTYKINIDLPVFFDWEYDSKDYAVKNGVNPTKSLVTSMTEAFCAEIIKLGYDAGYYMNHDYKNNYYNASKLKKYKLWFADYEDTYKDCFLQQTSCEGKVDGIAGDVDIDVLRGKLKTEKARTTNSTAKQKKSSDKAPEKSQSSYYIVGNTYKINVLSALNVRKGPGKNYALVGYKNLTEDGKKHAYRSGALKNGTSVTVLEVKSENGITWIRIPSGWICAEVNGTKYVI